MIDFYELLNIKSDATIEEIKEAYKKMVKKYHPDVNNSEEANKTIRSLNEAKEILLNETKRNEYDRALNELKQAKQFSKKKEETYKTKKQEYKETYEKVYVTKWEYYKDYIKYSKDNIWIKCLKSFFISINACIFSILKFVFYIFIYLLFYLQEFVEYLIGFIFILSIIALIGMTDKTSPDLIPGLSANVEAFLGLIILGILIFIGQLFLMSNYVNIYGLFGKLENKIFVRILL